MNLILVCLKNFQEYILVNLEHLIKLKNEKIYVITESSFFDNFDKYKEHIILVSIDDLQDTYSYKNKTTLNKHFRNGFWQVTSERFFYIYELIKRQNLDDCIHIENDVLLYYNIKDIIDKVDKNYLYLPFDTFKRNIASIMYIPNKDVYKQVLDNYDYTLNDMENFAQIQQKTKFIKNFPIFASSYANTEEEKFVSENYGSFDCIFDAAAIGQFVGGVDPRNIPGDTRGFINETCVIKYNQYDIFWITEHDIKRPFIKINDNIIPIFNLHIHSKNLANFV